jgi:hypothetical protein
MDRGRHSGSDGMIHFTISICLICALSGILSLLSDPEDAAESEPRHSVLVSSSPSPIDVPMPARSICRF